MSNTTANEKTSGWLPLATNQIRLRHLCQICGRSLVPPPSFDPTDGKNKNYLYYFTLHITLMSAPFYTSETLAGENIDWLFFDTRKFPESIVTAASGVVVRLWIKNEDSETPPMLVTVWGVDFSGLVFVGTQIPKEITNFPSNWLVFGMTWGYFMAPGPLTFPLEKPREVQVPEQEISISYNVESMAKIHRLQRAIHKQNQECERLRQDIKIIQSQPIRARNKSFLGSDGVVNPTVDRKVIQELRTRRQIALSRLALLQEEKTKSNKVVGKLQERLKQLRIESHTIALHLKEKLVNLRTQEDRLNAEICSSSSVKEILQRIKLLLLYRRRQLLTDLANIFPISEARNGLFSINGVMLPNSEDFLGFDETLLTIALGHVAHLVHMISVLLQIPNRYPVRVRSSISRVVDEVNTQIAENEREFPLYSKGKDKLFFQYAVYLLNKDIAQLRWYCGLNTQDLAATLPNLAGLMQRLLSHPSGDLSNGPRVVRAQTLTDSCETLSAAASPTFSSEGDNFKWQFRSSSEFSLSSMLEMPLARSSSPSLTSQDLCNVNESPQIDAYFCQPPPHGSRDTASLDLAATPTPVLTVEDPLIQRSGSAPNLTSPEILRSGQSQDSQATIAPPTEANNQSENGKNEKIAIGEDDILDNVTARTEALANSSSTFKLFRRGRNLSQNYS